MTPIDPLAPDHQNLVKWAARRALPAGRMFGLELDDLNAYGQMGLLKACRKYDASRGTKFTSYATRLIRQSISLAIVQWIYPVAIPRDTWFAIGRGEAGNTRAEMARMALRAEDQGGRMELVVLDHHEDPSASPVDSEAILRAVDALDRRARNVVRRHFGLGGMETQSQQQIARHLGVSTTRVQTIEAVALRRLRASLGRAC